MWLIPVPIAHAVGAASAKKQLSTAFTGEDIFDIGIHKTNPTRLPPRCILSYIGSWYPASGVPLPPALCDHWLQAHEGVEDHNDHEVMDS